MPMLLFFVRWKLWCFDIYRSSVGICPSSFALLQAEPKGIGERLGRVVEVVCSGQALVPMPGRINRRAKAMHWKKQGKRLAGDRCLFFFSAGCFPSLYGVIIIRRMYIYVYIDTNCVYIYIHRYVCINICIHIYVYVYGSNYVHHFCVKIASCSGQLLLGWESSETAESVAWLDH